MKLSELTPEKQFALAKEIAKDNGLIWEELTEAQRSEWMIEATFCCSWFCE